MLAGRPGSPFTLSSHPKGREGSETFGTQHICIGYAYHANMALDDGKGTFEQGVQPIRVNKADDSNHAAGPPHLALTAPLARASGTAACPGR